MFTENSHLEEVELAAVADGIPDIPERAKVFNHLANCSPCRRRLLKTVIDKGGEFLKARPPMGSIDGCPDPQEWLRLAAGLVRSDSSRILLQHAVACDACGELLKEAQATCSEDLSSEEIEAVSRLPLEDARQRALLSERMSDESAGPLQSAARLERELPRPRLRLRWVAAVAAAPVAFVAVGLWWIMTADSPERVSRLLAQAYGERRVFDLRVVDGAYGPVRRERGAGSPFDKPVALLNAEAQIRQALVSNAEDVQWLSLRGRAQLLEGEPDEAVKTLTLANTKAPTDVRILTDLGIAYAERADTPTAGSDDPAKAIEFLERAKQSSPKNLDVIFNLGLVYERQKMYAMADQMWKEYLKLDSSSKWADEARAHLDSLPSKTIGIRLRQELPRTPQAFLDQLNSGRDVYPEVLLERIVFTDWPGKPLEDIALNRLAQLLVSQHHDQWLVEALRQPEAFRFLSAATKANIDEDYQGAREQAASAERLYSASRNLAGQLRAQVERAYALRREANGPDCLRIFDPKALEKIRDAYPWVYAKLELEFAGCSNLTVRVGTALAASERALLTLREAKYRSLELQAASFVASYRRYLGDVRPLYRDSLRTLGVWWEGPYPGVLAQNLLLNLSTDADTSGYRFAAWAYKKEGMIAFQPDAPVAFMALVKSRLASSAVWIDKVEEAKAGYREADRLFAMVPDSAAKRSYLANAEKVRAEALAGTQPSTALKVLEAGEAMPYPLEEMRRAEMLGDVNRRLGRYKESEESYARAVEIAETRARELNAENRNGELLADAENAYKGFVESLIRNHADWSRSFEVWERFRSGIIQAVDPSLEAGEAFLTYAVLPDGVAAWLHDGTSVRGAWLPPVDREHQSLIETFARQCGTENSDESWKATSRALYEWLIRPVEVWFGNANTVIVETDSALSRIPFSALIDAKGQPISERFALVSSSNISVYAARGRGKRGFLPAEPALVLANPELRGDMRRTYPDLSEAETEAAQIKLRFPNARIFRKKEATVEILEKYGVTASLVHFAGHGIGNARNGGLLLSAIGEGEADILDTSRIERQNWKRCQLVTLASCSAAREDASPDNSLTLVRAFLAAGARRVLAARWNVDSAATSELMREFYGELAQGVLPSIALQRAASVVRSRWPHPHYWSAFELFGYK
jgi:CHAT domain-containing protein